MNPFAAYAKFPMSFRNLYQSRRDGLGKSLVAIASDMTGLLIVNIWSLILRLEALRSGGTPRTITTELWSSTATPDARIGSRGLRTTIRSPRRIDAILDFGRGNRAFKPSRNVAREDQLRRHS